MAAVKNTWFGQRVAVIARNESCRLYDGVRVTAGSTFSFSNWTGAYVLAFLWR